MADESYSLIQEFSNEYSVKQINESEVEIHILIPKKYETLWLMKLSELRINEIEVAKYEEK